jgi:predicted ArsR family transcriptional regulator
VAAPIDPGDRSASRGELDSQSALRLDVLKALGDNTRYAIYLELARSARPLTTAEIAETLQLHPNTVRPHLDRMREVGLLDVDVDGRGAPGRPQHRYSLSHGAPSLGLEPPVMPAIASMVLRMAERAGATPDDAAEVGHTEGRHRAQRYAEAPSTLEALVTELDRWGFDPVVADGSDDDSVVVAFAHCPFQRLAESQPQLVCGLHRGLVSGFVAGMGDAEVAEFCSLVHRTPCQMTLR